MTHVEEAIAEIDGRLAAFAPILEGLRDYYRLNIIDGAKDVVIAAMSAYDGRIGILNASRDALLALMADGHPDIPNRQIDEQALQDLQQNAATIQAALGIFTAEALAAMLGLKAGSAEQK